MSPSRMVTTAYFNARALVDSTKAFNPLGDGQNAVSRYEWDPTWDMPTRIIAPTLEQTTQGLDAATGNTLWQRVGTNALNTVTFAYHPTTKQLVAMYTPGITNPDTILYDAMGNDTMTVSPGGIWSRSRLDAIGRDTLVISPIDATRQQSQRIIYDLADQVRESRTEGPAMPYALSMTTDTAAVRAETLFVRMDYDREGNVLRVHKFAAPDSNPWLNACDAPVGQCAGIDPADVGSVDIRTYDNVNRLLTQRLSSGGRSFEYDLSGNVEKKRMWNGQFVLMTYDAGGRLTRSITPTVTAFREECEGHAPSPVSGTPCLMHFPIYPNLGDAIRIVADTARFAFDYAGNLAGAYNNVSRVNRTYLPSGAVATESQVLRDYAGALFNLTNTIGYGYDLSGRRRVTRPPTAGDSIRYGYDPDRGTLTNVWHGSSHVRFTYDRAGRQDSLLIANGTTVGIREERRYDPDGQLLKRIRTSTAIGYLITDSLAYDLRGKVRYVATESRSNTVNSLQFFTHYSGLGAVVAQAKLKPNTAGWDLEEFRTSALGDVYRSRTTNSMETPRFPTVATYNPLGALVRRQPVRDGLPESEFYRDTTYASIDADGNVLRTGTVWQSTTTAPTEYSHTRSYFAADNRLRYIQRYSGPQGTKTGSWEEHWYDALGRKVLTRARRDSINLCTGAWCASYIERTVWDGDQILVERRGLGGDTVSAGGLNTHVAPGLDYGEVGYVHAGGMDAPLVLMNGRVPNYNWRGLPESSVWTDGTAADCSVSGGGTCTTIAWPSTGVYLRPVGNTGGNQPTWVGSLLANGVGSTGMAYRRNRFYDGTTGQFNQQDPIGLAGGANAYGFADGDPVNYSDPFGLCIPWPSCANKYWDDAAVAGHRQGGVLGTMKAAGSVLMGSLIEGFGVNQADRGMDQIAEGNSVRGGALVGLAIIGNLPGGNLLKVEANLARTVKAAQGAEVTAVAIGRLTRATWTIPGKDGGASRTVWNKIINSQGKTIRMYHDSYNPAGVFQHRKFKVPDTHIAY